MLQLWEGIIHVVNLCSRLEGELIQKSHWLAKKFLEGLSTCLGLTYCIWPVLWCTVWTVGSFEGLHVHVYIHCTCEEHTAMCMYCTTCSHMGMLHVQGPAEDSHEYILHLITVDHKCRMLICCIKERLAHPVTTWPALLTHSCFKFLGGQSLLLDLCVCVCVCVCVGWSTVCALNKGEENFFLTLSCYLLPTCM